MQSVGELANALSRAFGTRERKSPRIGVVLGSGLGAFANALEASCAVPYARLPGMPRARVAGHAGNFVAGTHAGVSLCVMQGRVHAYEGHGASEVVRGVRAMITLGVRTLILTNAAGGIRSDLAPGELMLIADHLNLTGASPLIGPNDDALGPRFPALSNAYEPRLRALAEKLAREQHAPIKSGVYAGLLGPAYETPAEVRMLRAWGADAVGMSTVLETIAARHMGAAVLGISCITNRAAGLDDNTPNHAEVQATARTVEGRFVRLLAGLVSALGREVPG
jgi:purine-nucleoside phosphorylase